MIESVMYRTKIQPKDLSFNILILLSLSHLLCIFIVDVKIVDKRGVFYE